MQVLQNVFWLFVLIGIMVIIHELGHYWAARYFNVRVEAFAVGFGPRLFGFRKGETEFKICAIPLGGYVKMAGETINDEGTGMHGEAVDPNGFQGKPRWQRLIIAAAGPAMNIMLAVALLTGLYMVQYPEVLNADGPARIGYMTPNSPAAKAGLQEGDEIVQIDNVTNPTWKDVVLKEIASANRSLDVAVVRNGDRKVFAVTPVLDDANGVGDAGWTEQSDVQIAGVMPGMDAERVGLRAGDVVVSINGEPVRSVTKLQEVLRVGKGAPVQIVYQRNGQQQTATVTPKLQQGEPEARYLLGVQLSPRVRMTQLPFMAAFRESVQQNVEGAGLIFSFLRGIVERRMSAKSLQGPIGIGQLAGQAAREGATTYIGLMAMVSLNLAIFNLLPIPILDGGVILLLLVEMVMRRDLSTPVRETIIKVGFVFLMMIVVFVLYNDLRKILLG